MTKLRNKYKLNPEQEDFYSYFPKCHTAIFGPDGKVISNVLKPLEEGIGYAEIDLEKIIDQKYYMDPAGHYSNCDLTMTLDHTRQPSVSLLDNPKEDYVPFDILNPVTGKTPRERSSLK